MTKESEDEKKEEQEEKFEEKAHQKFFDEIAFDYKDFKRHRNFADNIPPETSAGVIKVRIEDCLRLRDRIEANYRLLRLIKLKEESKRHLNEVIEDFYKIFWVTIGTLKDANKEPQTDNPTTQVKRHTKIKFPIIPLPEFDGNLSKWIEFRDKFESLVHNNTDLSQIEKFHYLSSSIKLPAGQQNVLQNFALSDAAYEEAWAAVKQRYDDKQKLKATQFNMLLSVKRMTSESASEVQRIYDSFTHGFTALDLLGATEDDFRVHIVQYRLDETTQKDWKKYLNNEEPTWELMKTFLFKQWKTLDSLPAKKLQNIKQPDHKTSGKTFSTTTQRCVICSGSHSLYQCSKFHELSVNQRFSFVNEKHLCRNCLGSNHQQKDCPSTKRCKICNRNHHSLLHFEKRSAATSQSSQPTFHPECPPFQPVPPPAVNYPSTSNVQSSLHSATMMTFENCTEALLTTVCFLVLDAYGKWRRCRALLDSGSQSNYITTEFAESLGIKLEKTLRTVIGVNGQVSAIKKRTDVIFSSTYVEFFGTIDCSVSDDITGYLPNRPIDIRCLKIPTNIVLSDTTFHIPGKIDMLLGTKWYHESLLTRVIRQENQPTLVETKFGWTVGGEFPVPSPASTYISCFTQSPNSDRDELNEKIEKFLELESIGSKNKSLSAEEKHCLKLFDLTTRQDSTGRVFVHLPFNNKVNELGSNWNNSLSQFFMQEKKRNGDSQFNLGYCEYFREYESSQHMTELSINSKTDGYFLPHHGVVRASSTSTKIRPVFNASSKSETGKSLNDVMCNGPIVQPELIDILYRFREGAYVLKADIEKMFRQIFVEETHRKFLKIIWRLNPSDPIRVYQLNTVTFGLKCAPFLATQALNYLADKNKHLSRASEEIKRSIYVDDLVMVFHDLDEALTVREEIRKIFSSAQIPLKKWTSNCRNLLANLPESDVEKLENENSVVKTLGVDYYPVHDVFGFTIEPLKEEETTKTTVLSRLASFYDPYGIVGPVTFIGKLFMKPLRCLKWTEKVPEDQRLRWIDYQTQLLALNQLKVNRRILLLNPVQIQIIGFCDASELGYGAVIYLRSSDTVGNVKIALLCSKSRVSPPKKQTIARLELCSCVLLSKLAVKVLETLKCSIDEVMLWTDSTIALFWIATETYRLTTFVGNRVAVIQDDLLTLRRASWRHIRTNLNPADCLSRGISPEEIASCTLWWNGPRFLSDPIDGWPESLMTVNETDPDVHQELKKTFVLHHDVTLINLIEYRFSKLTKLEFCFAYIRRFASAAGLRQKGSISVEEIEAAFKNIIRIVQKTLLPIEYDFFIKQRENPLKKLEFPRKSSILSLTPFMDEELIIRVGGRVQESPGLTTNQKHQVILPHCNFGKLIIRQIHQKNFHPGPSAMLSFLRENYWPLKAKQTIRQVQHECLICFRAKPLHATQIMANLPEARVKMSPAFERVAVDYAGHFNLRPSLTARSTVVKCYIALFKCMATGAIHLEVVTSLSTAGFFAAFDRFISRRGLPVEIFSDNGTQFVGANNEFTKILNEIEKEIGEFLREKRIKWIFTAPLAPHAGGYYESGIKTMKHYLLRECDNRSFDYEQFATLLCKIEAVVNSRPLTPMSEDPNDLEVLTPAHFIIGRSLIAKPERNFLPVATNRLDKYNQLQQLQQKFWASWYHDYLHHLQQRPNEFRLRSEFHLGDMVLIMDKNLPSLKWKFGRISKLLPDKTGVVRRVIVKTATGEKDRNVRYLCLLPLEH